MELKKKKREHLQPWLYSNRIPHFRGEVQYVQVSRFYINFGVGGGIWELRMRCVEAVPVGSSVAAKVLVRCGRGQRVWVQAHLPTNLILSFLPVFPLPRGGRTPYQMDITLKTPRLWHLYTPTLSFLLSRWVCFGEGITWDSWLSSCALSSFTLLLWNWSSTHRSEPSLFLPCLWQGNAHAWKRFVTYKAHAK